METNPTPALITPPALIQSILAGFNLVASHIYLIIFPILLDLIFWFAPRLRINSLMQPVLQDLGVALNGMAQPDVKETVMLIWQTAAERFNLLSSLRAFPVGIPSLMMAQAPIQTPLGLPLLVEAPNFGAAFSIWLLCALLGITFGSLYFNLLARSTVKNAHPLTINHLLWETLQSLLLLLLLLALLTVIGIPASLIISLIVIASPALAQLALIIMFVSILWMLLPLIFSAHGIFSFDLNVLHSTLLSYRLVRFYLPGTGLFILLSLLISQGLDIIWRIPPENSWMALVGILGHAFISTALLAASFVYYMNGMMWMKQTLQAPLPGQSDRV